MANQPTNKLRYEQQFFLKVGKRISKNKIRLEVTKKVGKHV